MHVDDGYDELNYADDELDEDDGALLARAAGRRLPAHRALVPEHRWLCDLCF